MIKKISSRAKKLLPLIGLVIFIYLIYRLGFEEIQDSILSISPAYIIISGLLTIPVMVIRNYAWQLILKEQKIELGFLKSLKILLIGYFYGTISPGYIGQLVKVLYMKEETGDPYGKLFVNSLVEVLLRTFSLYLMMVIGALLVTGMLPELLPITLTWVVVLTIIIIYFIRKERGEKLFSLLNKYFVPKRLKNQLSRFTKTFYKDFPRLKKLIFPFILGTMTWVIIFTQEYLFVVALGLNISYLYFLLLFPIANTAGYLPITFAGLGTRELTAIFIFSTLFAAPEEKIFVVSIMGFLITDILIGFIGFILSLFEIHPKKLRTLLK